jgi:hypothetical protein
MPRHSLLGLSFRRYPLRTLAYGTDKSPVKRRERQCYCQHNPARIFAGLRHSHRYPAQRPRRSRDSSVEAGSVVRLFASAAEESNKWTPIRTAADTRTLPWIRAHERSSNSRAVSAMFLADRSAAGSLVTKLNRSRPVQGSGRLRRSSRLWMECSFMTARCSQARRATMSTKWVQAEELSLSPSLGLVRRHSARSGVYQKDP